MRNIFKIILVLIFYYFPIAVKSDIKPIIEGNHDAKVKIIIFESLTCSHCANFHKKIYPSLKEDFIDRGLVSIEFKNFPLDMAAFNGSKIAHCKNDGKTEILHYLFKNQNKWAKGKNIEEFNLNLKNIIYSGKFELDFQKCIDNKIIEDHILEDRIDAMKKFKINATPTLIINNKKFDKPLNFKNLKKTIEKLI